MMSIEEDVVELRGRIAALNLVVITQTVLDGMKQPDFNPVEFAAQRSSFWKQIGSALNDDQSPSSVAIEKALGKLGELLVFMAKPIDDEMRKRSG